MTHATIRSGIPWHDDRGSVVNAHGACVVEEGGRYYLFGEYKADEGNAFGGFACYSSLDLVNWTFERMALPVQPEGLLGPDRIGERPKVMKCPSTGQFVMYMHADDLRYMDPHIGVATSATIDGEFIFRGPLLHGDEPLRRWDMGTFQDRDGTGYVLVHDGDIYRLSTDYLTIDAQVATGIAEGGESPAMLEHEGQYFIIFSNKTMWERNDNYYLSAPSPAGPWVHRGLLAPEGTLTHNSQCTFVLRIQRGDESTYMYMGDRWSFPRQASSASYVWLPLTVGGSGISLPAFLPEWSLEGSAPVEPEPAQVDVQFAARLPGASVEIPFSGGRAAVHGDTNSQSGYARLEVHERVSGRLAHAGYVDFYSLVESTGLRYLSPALPAGDYTLRLTVTGEMPVSYNKAGTRFGATDSFVTVTGVSCDVAPELGD